MSCYLRGNTERIFLNWFLSIALHILYCALKSCDQANKQVRIPRTRPVLFFNQRTRSKEVGWSLALERARWAIFLLHNFGEQIIPSKLEKLKKNIEGKKRYIEKRVRSMLLEDANYDFESNDSRNVLSRCCLKVQDFSTDYTLNYSDDTLETFFLSSFQLLP